MFQKPLNINLTMKKFTYGGQAIIEGVMIRGKTCYSIAIRTPTGSIITKSFNLNSFLNGPARKIPMIRGVLTLIEMLFIGTKSLSYSAEIASKETDNPESHKESATDISLIITMIFSLIFGITLFFLIPLYISSLFENFLHLHVISNIFEGFLYKSIGDPFCDILPSSSSTISSANVIASV